jgi:hypothetical protein
MRGALAMVAILPLEEIADLDFSSGYRVLPDTVTLVIHAEGDGFGTLHVWTVIPYQRDGTMFVDYTRNVNLAFQLGVRLPLITLVRARTECPMVNLTKGFGRALRLRVNGRPLASTTSITQRRCQRPELMPWTRSDGSHFAKRAHPLCL